MRVASSQLAEEHFFVFICKLKWRKFAIFCFQPVNFFLNLFF